MKFNVVARWLSGLCLLVPKIMESDEFEIYCTFFSDPIKGRDATWCNINDTVPADLSIDKNTESLILANNDTTRPTLVAREPLNYPNLINFVAITNVFSVPQNFFSPLHNLKRLGLLLHNFTKDKIPDLPHSITELSINAYVSKPAFDMSKLYNLEELEFTVSAYLIALPNLPNTAPIKKLNFYNSTLINLTLPDIAQYCQLKDVNLDNTLIQPPPPNNSNYWHTDRLYCEFKVWFETHNISYVLSSRLLDKTYDANSCPGTVLQNPEAEAKYKACLKRTEKKPTMKTETTAKANVIVGVIIGLAFILLIIGLLYVSRRRNEED